MYTPHILLVICIGSVLTYDLQQRPTKIRFPTEATPLTQQIYTVGPPPQLYESESQAVPVVIKGLDNLPFTVLQQVPITNIPQYADLGAKGFNDGLMNFYQPFIRQEGEFHHTVPPPVRIPSYTLQKTVTHSKPKEQIHLQNIQYKPQRHQERVRVPTQKYIAKPMKARPTSPSLQQAPTHLQFNKDFKQHIPQQLPIYKYPIAMHQVPQNGQQHSEYTENQYDEEYYKRPIPNKQRLSQESKPIPQYSDESTDFEGKLPGWKLKGSVRDVSYESNSNFYQQHQSHRPEAEDSKYYDEESEESFSYEEQPQERPLNYNKYNKHHVTSQSNINYYRPKNELKKFRESSNENIKQYNYQAKPTSVEIFSSKDLTDSLPYLSKNEKYKNPIQYHTYGSKKLEELEKPKQTSSSEWIPINAPDGALPAKSYDIPAPDLSRGQAHWLSHSAQSDESISEQNSDNEDSIRNQRQNNVVYGGRKQQGEGVVSASVMVKQ